MAARMLLVNPALPPSKRKRKIKPAKRGNTMSRKRVRSAAQKAATRRLVAANRARRAPAKRAKRRANPLALATVSRRRRNPIARARVTRRRRRNPVASKGAYMDMMKQSAIAASGALVLDAAWGYLPIPANFKIGGISHVAKGAGAIVMGMLASKVVSKRTASNMTLGALTVIMHNAAREVMATALPAIRMDGLGYYSPGMVVGGMNEYVNALPAGGMGEYVSPNMTVDQRVAMDGYNYYG